MDEYTLRAELLRAEDSTRQFKRQLPKPSDLAKELCAFLNTRGGKLFIGVEDDGTICGLPPGDLNQKFDNDISGAASDGVRPAANILTFNVPTEDGMVVVIEIPEGSDKPYSTNKGEFYVKRGADKRRVIERSEILRLLTSGAGIHTDVSAAPGSSLSDLDYTAIAGFYNSRFGDETLAAPEDEEELSRQLRGIRFMRDEQLTITGALLFAKYPEILLPSFHIMAIWFKGTDRGTTEYRDSKRLEGTLQAQFEKAMAFTAKWNSRVQTGSFNDNGDDEIPPIVFEELIVNALVHRDYAIPDSIKLYIFDDRIEITSPGALPNSLTEEEALKGIGRDRNSQIESFAYDLMNFRGARSGLRRVRKQVPDLQLHNDIEGEEVRVIVPLGTA